LKIDPRRQHELNQMLDRICPAGTIRVVDILFYPGASPFSVRPTLVCSLEAEPLTLSAASLQHRIDLRFSGSINLPAPALATLGASESIAAAAANLAAALLSHLLGFEFRFGLEADEQGRTQCWLESHTLPTSLQAFAAALACVAEAAGSAAGGSPVSQELILSLERICSSHRPNNGTSLVLIKAAQARDIPFLPASEDPSFWQFGWGRRSRLFWQTGSDGDGLIGFRISRNKAAAKSLLRELEVPTPDWFVVHPDEDARAAARAIGFPCVVKPLDLGGGKGVTADIVSMAEFEKAVELARSYAPVILIETHAAGVDHRLMVIDGKLRFAVQRRPPSVVGDGISMISQLVSALNHSRRGSPKKPSYSKPVVTDASMEALLASQSVTLDTVLPSGQRVQLRSIANNSTGGFVEDVTRRVHPEVKALAEQVAVAFGIRVCGVDYLAQDVGRSPQEAGGVVIEVNATPGLAVICAAGADEVEIGSVVLGDAPGRIPGTLMLAPAAQHQELEAELARLLADRPDAGLATMNGGRIGARKLPAPRRGPLRLVKTLLRYTSLASIHILWSQETLCDVGAPLDRFDKVVIFGPPPSAAWLSLLHRLTEEIVFVESAEAALGAIMAPAQVRAGASAVPASSVNLCRAGS
jgi:cyanophycin synthetase